jgi:hypothetical protein
MMLLLLRRVEELLLLWRNGWPLLLLALLFLSELLHQHNLVLAYLSKLVFAEIPLAAPIHQLRHLLQYLFALMPQLFLLLL